MDMTDLEFPDSDIIEDFDKMPKKSNVNMLIWGNDQLKY
jgi:hypothetical protein